MQSDGDLARRAQDGDDEAFEALARRHVRAAFLTALAILVEPADAEDAVQDALVRAWTRLGQCRDPDRFAPWLRKIVRSVSLNHLRRVRARRESGPSDLPLAGDPTEAEGQLQRAELQIALTTALRSLSPGQREVLLLHDFHGLRHSEVANALGISEAMSRRHLSDARRRMREAPPLDSHGLAE